MSQSGKSFLHLNAGHSQGLDQREYEIAGYRPPHQPPSGLSIKNFLIKTFQTALPVVVAEDAGGDEETAGVWPGYDLVLAPPPRDDNAATLTLWISQPSPSPPTHLT